MDSSLSEKNHTIFAFFEPVTPLARDSVQRCRRDGRARGCADLETCIWLRLLYVGVVTTWRAAALGAEAGCGELRPVDWFRGRKRALFVPGEPDTGLRGSAMR